MPPKRKKSGASGDAAKGEKIFKNLCSACHALSVIKSILKVQSHSTGPALGAIPGQNIASGEGFNYSAAL